MCKENKNCYANKKAVGIMAQLSVELTVEPELSLNVA